MLGFPSPNARTRSPGAGWATDSRAEGRSFVKIKELGRWASDSSALVALHFPAKPKRAAGDKKRVPLRERMAAARGPAELH